MGVPVAVFDCCSSYSAIRALRSASASKARSADPIIFLRVPGRGIYQEREVLEGIGTYVRYSREKESRKVCTGNLQHQKRRHALVENARV